MEDEFFFGFADKPRREVLIRAACDRCGLYKAGCRSPKMKPDGLGRRRVLVVSDYPGKHEDAAGRPMAGPAGDLLERECRRLDVELRRDCVITNAQICYSPTASAHKTAVNDCRPNLLDTVKRVDPDVVLLLGAAAIKSLIGHAWRGDFGKPGDFVGRRIPCRDPNAWVCPSYNPAHLLYSDADPADADRFRDHLAAAFALRGKPWPDGPPPDPASRVEVLTDPHAAAVRLRSYSSGLVAFDFETTCVKPHHPTRSKIVCASACRDGRETIAFPWLGPVKAAAAELLTNPDVGKIAHNIQFEDQWAREKLGVEVRGWFWDTMTSAHALDPRGASATGLDHQAFVRLGYPDWSSHVEPYLKSDDKSGYAVNRVEQVKPSALMKYCGVDSLASYELCFDQRREAGLD